MKLGITPRLMPGACIAGAWLSVDPTDRTDHRGKPVWRYCIDGPTFEYEGDDLAGWDAAPGMLATLISFLEAAGESWDYMQRTGKLSEFADLFPEYVAEWAAESADELSMVREELEAET